MPPDDQTNNPTKIDNGSLPALPSNDSTTTSGDDQSNAALQTSSGTPTGSAQGAINISVPDEAADSDLIEKEWVERAKQIVEHTKNDPFEQQRAINQMKADYMKKRYNKDTNTN